MMAAPLALRRSARIKAAREKKTPTTATETERTHTRRNRPFYSYVWACHGQLIPIEKRLPRHRFHRGALADLAPDHWLIVAKTRWYMFNSLIGSYDGDSEVPPISGKYGLEARTPSHEWWLSQPVSLLRYWMDIMGFFSYLDHCEVERDSGGLVWREPKTPKEYVEAMEHMRVKLVMYKVYRNDDEWEVADNARPYFFIPEEMHKLFVGPLKADLDRHSVGVTMPTGQL